jgi:hypothetical protein
MLDRHRSLRLVALLVAGAPGARTHGALMPAAYVRPYVKRQKNDAADAEAICEAVTGANMRFVEIKTPEQQSCLMLHRTRHLLIRQRSAEGIMASDHVNRANRPNTWLPRPAKRREDSPCQLAAVHTWHNPSFSLRLLLDRSGHREPAQSRIIIVQVRAIATSSTKRLDQAKFQIKADATKHNFFATKSEKGRPRFHSAGPERRSRWSMGASARRGGPLSTRRTIQAVWSGSWPTFLS